VGRRPAHELIYAAVAIATITAWYVYQSRGGLPRPSSRVGHGLGTVGFLLMLSSQVLYSLRKRVAGFHRGPTAVWLQWHVFTGIVGPYLVLLHSAGKFHGVAGALALLTVITVLSGFVGRFLYTAVPRTLDGNEVSEAAAAERLAAARRLLAAWHRVHVPLTGLLFTLAVLHILGAMYYATFLK
jgi:hypothetical protein